MKVNKNHSEVIQRRDYKLKQIEVVEPEYSPRPRKKRDWVNYNLSQKLEKLLFLELAFNLCSFVADEKQGNGRPRVPKSDLIYCMLLKVYNEKSGRRNNSEVELAHRRGYLLFTPHYNTILKYFNDQELTSILYNLIELSALPLKDLEVTFAVDASGLTSRYFQRWVSSKTDFKNHHNWIKVNLICGVKSGIVTSVKVLAGREHESPTFKELVLKTDKFFDIKEVSADKGYSSVNNIETVWNLGATPYIPFKKNVKRTPKSKRGCWGWKKMHDWYHFHKLEFLQRYHLRSNVESVFSAMKRQFGNNLYMKNETAMTNEALCKILCYNLCVLIKVGIELNIDNGFGKFVNLFPNLSQKSDHLPIKVLN